MTLQLIAAPMAPSLNSIIHTTQTIVSPKDLVPNASILFIPRDFRQAFQMLHPLRSRALDFSTRARGACNDSMIAKHQSRGVKSECITGQHKDSLNVCCDQKISIPGSHTQ